jgi:hypothetical protein
VCVCVYILLCTWMNIMCNACLCVEESRVISQATTIDFMCVNKSVKWAIKASTKKRKRELFKWQVNNLQNLLMDEEEKFKKMFTQ